MSEPLAVLGHRTSCDVVASCHEGFGKSLVGKRRMLVLGRYDIVEYLKYLMCGHIIVGIGPLVEKELERIHAMWGQYILA